MQSHCFTDCNTWTRVSLALSINIFAEKSSRSDWGSNPLPTATPPSTINVAGQIYINIFRVKTPVSPYHRDEFQFQFIK
jgi:hypothetical protein